MQLREDPDYIFMQKKLLPFLIHIKKIVTQVDCSHSVATGRYFGILCCLHWLLIKKNEKQRKVLNIIANLSFTHTKHCYHRDQT